MPFVWRIYGFNIYFWLNENGEPIHFHISKGKRGSSNTKFWIYSDGTIHLCHNNSRYKKQEINKIIALQYNIEFTKRITNEWLHRFGQITFIK